MNENKQMICNLLLPALQATRNLYDLTDLHYDEENEVVVASFDGGSVKVANVACDSGTAMIRDIIKSIV